MKKQTLADKNTIEVFNINSPGKSQHLQHDKYKDMQKGLFQLLPSTTPGFTQSEMIKDIPDYLSPEIFPDGEKAGWWLKAVQLDLEARNMLIREKCTPLRWHRNTDTSTYREPVAKNIPAPPRPTYDMPPDVGKRIEKAKLLETYNERPYYQRNDYIGWILQAKRDETKEKRIAQMLEELEAGDIYMKMAWGKNT